MTHPSLKELIQKLFAYVFKRPLQNFAIEDRAEKVLESKALRNAPRHASTKAQMEEFAKNHPEILEELNKKPQDLLDRLKSVKVAGGVQRESPGEPALQKALPVNRTPVEVPLYGFQEPKNVVLGKVTLKEVVEFLTLHQEEHEEWNAQKVSQTYNLDQTVAEDILKHYSILMIRFPAKKDKDAIGSGQMKIQGLLGKQEEK